MDKTLLILRHEFVATIRRVGFIILTLSLPVLALLGIAVFQIISGVAKPPPETTLIGYVDQAGEFSRFKQQGAFLFASYASQEAAAAALVKEEIKEFLIIPADY